MLNSAHFLFWLAYAGIGLRHLPGLAGLNVPIRPVPQAWANDCKTLFYVTKDKLDRQDRR